MSLALLLNWRVWAVLLICLGEAAFGWKCYVSGKHEVQTQFDAYIASETKAALAAEEAARVREHDLQTAKQKVDVNYANLKTATATAVGALDADRMSLQSELAAARRAAGDSKTGPGIDAAAEDNVLSRCTERYTTVAGEAKAQSDKIIGLQDYVNNVVFAPKK
jgi:hypothetical protein